MVYNRNRYDILMRLGCELAKGKAKVEREPGIGGILTFVWWVCCFQLKNMRKTWMKSNQICTPDQKNKLPLNGAKILWGWHVLIVHCTVFFLEIRSQQINYSGKRNSNHTKKLHFFCSIYTILIPDVWFLQCILGYMILFVTGTTDLFWIDQLNADISELNINIFGQPLWWLCLVMRLGICGCQDAQSAGDLWERPMIVLAQSFIFPFQSVLCLN